MSATASTTVLSSEQTRLIEDNTDLIRLAINAVIHKTRRRAGADEYDEMEGEVSRALVEAAHRWPAYCAERGYSPDENEWFRIYATRRMKGAIIDMWRRDSPLTRTELDYSTHALRHGVSAAATRYNVSEAVVQAAVERRELLVTPGTMPESAHAPASPTLWESLHRAVEQMPLVARVWVALVFVGQVPVMEARKLLGITDPRTAVELAGYVEYALVSAVLAGAENR